MTLQKGVASQSAATTAELNKLVAIPSGAALVVAEEVTYTETTGAGTYTGAVTVPAGATILDIKIFGAALWTATTSALMDVGDVADPDGFYTQIDLKATDLLADEQITFITMGGKGGAYINSPVEEKQQVYDPLARVITGTIVTVGAAGNAGRTRMLVKYVLPTAVAAVKT